MHVLIYAIHAVNTDYNNYIYNIHITITCRL